MTSQMPMSIRCISVYLRLDACRRFGFARNCDAHDDWWWTDTILLSHISMAHTTTTLRFSASLGKPCANKGRPILCSVGRISKLYYYLQPEKFFMKSQGMQQIHMYMKCICMYILVRMWELPISWNSTTPDSQMLFYRRQGLMDNECHCMLGAKASCWSSRLEGELSRSGAIRVD